LTIADLTRAFQPQVGNRQSEIVHRPIITAIHSDFRLMIARLTRRLPASVVNRQSEIDNRQSLWVAVRV
jgi:hypothetical protein